MTESTQLYPLVTSNPTTLSPSSLPLSQRLVFGAVAGMGAATICHPLDVIRIQMQTPGIHYTSTLDAATKIHSRAGLMNGLYAGISAAYLRQCTYGSFRIGIYSHLLERTQNDNLSVKREKNDISFRRKLTMGCISGTIGSFIGTPSELALVRMSSDSKLPLGERRNYSDAMDCIVRIGKEEGLTKLWRGAAPTVLRATLLNSAQLGVTSEMKERLGRSGWFGIDGSHYHGIPVMVCSTLCASFVASVVANPLDVVKSRLQSMKVDVNGKAMYSGMLDCLVKSVSVEGVMVLWSGFTPAFGKLAPFTVISLTLADKLTKIFTGKDAL